MDNNSTLAPLRVSTFRAIWMASIVSNFGGLIQGVGAGWMMTSISDSAAMVALVQASTTLPIMTLSLVAGAVADSFDRRKVMLAAQIFMALVSASLAACAWFGLITPWFLLTFTFLIGCGGAFNNPAWQASVGDIVPREQVPSAVLLNSVAFNVTRSVGPGVGGAIVAAAGAAAAFAVNAVTYIGMIGVLWAWKPNTPRSSLPRERLTAAMTTGIRYVALSPNILKVLLRGFLFGLTTVVILALLPLVARHLIGGDALVYGMMLGAYGIGAVAGAMFSRQLREKLTNENLIRWSFFAFAFCASLTAISRDFWITAGALTVGGASWVIALSLFNTTVQMSTPRWVVGRALSLYQMAVFGGMASGSWIWGTIAERWSPDMSLLVAAAGMLVGAAVGIKVPLPSRENLNLDPLNRWREPRVALGIEPRSGPVAITIEYAIEAGNLDAFLQVMRERRRIRRRDGAHDWSLTQDLANPEVWVERFEVPTWVDYIRFHSRTTQADAHVSDRLQALHKGDWPPRIQRMLVWKGTAVRVVPPPPEPTEVL
ncbi:MAG: MFS transporter [Pseudomonadales bacterium]|nr:MFS transporter [Pseudomonadales bacterium]